MSISCIYFMKNASSLSHCSACLHYFIAIMSASHNSREYSSGMNFMSIGCEIALLRHEYAFDQLVLHCLSS